ncbi:MAG: cell division protein SepF [Firmicutes bacterium]|nr:cell division protein SepF [Bacillota bacterium]
MGYWDRVLNWFGLSDDEEYRDGAPPPPVSDLPSLQPVRKATVINLQRVRKDQPRVVVVQPANLDEAQVVVNHLKNRQPVVINLENCEVQEARRILDFTSGALAALGGNAQRINAQVFLFVPSEMAITSYTKAQRNSVEPLRLDKLDKNEDW